MGRGWLSLTSHHVGVAAIGPDPENQKGTIIDQWLIPL